jgi:Leucine-rich repeat (LRR) protein
LKNLTALILCKNAFTTLDGISRLPNLLELDVSHNQLAHIGELPTSLMKLDLSHNLLKRLPSLGELERLEKLDVSSNALTTLPIELRFFALKPLCRAHTAQQVRSTSCVSRKEMRNRGHIEGFIRRSHSTRRNRFIWQLSRQLASAWLADLSASVICARGKKLSLLSLSLIAKESTRRSSA